MVAMISSRTQAETERRIRRSDELTELAEAIVRILVSKPKKGPQPQPQDVSGSDTSLSGAGGSDTSLSGANGATVSSAVSLGPAEEAVPTGLTKTCTKCKLPKARERFPPHPDTADGLAAWCKDCRAVLRKRRGQENLVARLKHHFAARMTQQLNDAGIKEIPPLVLEMESYLGYRIADLIRHLDDDIQEREGISLKQAFRKGYHIDHITPLSKFPLGTIGDEVFQRCWAIDNLRAIPAADNLKKGAEDIFEGETTDE